MFIKDVQKFIHQFKMISEAVTLPQIRRGIVGKEKEIPVIDSDKEWYEEHKKEVLNTIEKALNVNDKTLKNNLQKFDTDDFFTNDRPRKLKVKELIKTLRKKFISEVERSRMTEEKTTGIESQYEMMKMKNGVEVYAVYTSLANKYLTHTKLWAKGCFSPTWCIASSSANNYWNHYRLYEADFPSVFIVAQKKNSVYNPLKYELKCNPNKSTQFKNGEISLKDWVDEWREPEQHEDNYNNTSLFDSFNITVEDLENVVYKLVNSEKSSYFSKKYGREMIELYTKKIETGDEDTKLEYLTKACKNGTFINFCDEIDEESKEYFLDELIRYGTLTEAEVEKMLFGSNKKVFLKALLNLIKNGRCTILSLEWAKDYFGGNMVRRVYKSLPDEILLMENFEGIDVRAKIFNKIRDVDGLTTEYANYLIQKGEVNDTTLHYVRNDKELLSKCVDCLIKNDKVDNYILYDVKDDKESLSKCVDYLIKNGKVSNDTLDYIGYDKEILTKCVDYLIKKGKVLNYTLGSVYYDKELSTKCVDYLIQKGEVDDVTLRYVKNDKELLTKCIYSMIQNGKVDNDTLEYVRNDNVLFEKCLEITIKNGTFINFCDKINKEDKEYFLDKLIRYGTLTEAEVKKMELMNNEKAILNLIKNKRCTYLSLEWAKKYFDGNMVRKVFHSLPDEILLMEKNFEGINVRRNIFEAIRADKGLTIEYANYLIQKGGVNSTTLRYVKDDRELLSRCAYSMIENDKVDNGTLEYYVKNGDRELLSKCIYSMIENDKVDNITLHFVKDDKELYLKCKNYLENK